MSAAAEALAEDMLGHWGGAARPPVLVSERENIVFQARLANGRVVALRLHRPGYQSRAAIEAELRWTAALARVGFAAPEPVPTQEGALSAVAGDRVASCVGWIDGQAIGAATTPLSGSRAEQAELFAEIGWLVGALHRLTDSLPRLAGLDRPVWDAEALLGENPRWGRFWENPAFAQSDRALILEARSLAREALETAAAKDDFGLIHADVLRENILRTDEGLSLIDFDDSGYGFRLYDLGTALVQNLEEPGLPEIAAALVEGYRQNRPAPSLTPDELILFVLLRTFASAGWIATRAGPGDRRQGFYAGRALRMARHFLAGTAPWA